MKRLLVIPLLLLSSVGLCETEDFISVKADSCLVIQIVEYGDTVFAIDCDGGIYSDNKKIGVNKRAANAIVLMWSGMTIDEYLKKRGFK